MAVAYGNQIAILRKDNDYREPVGHFTCKIYPFIKCRILFGDLKLYEAAFLFRNSATFGITHSDHIHFLEARNN